MDMEVSLAETNLVNFSHLPLGNTIFLSLMLIINKFYFTVYKLIAFISHMGSSSMVGHYVCHILKEGRWVIFNDEKVAVSQHPPVELGYLYIYERMKNQV